MAISVTTKHPVDFHIMLKINRTITTIHSIRVRWSPVMGQGPLGLPVHLPIIGVLDLNVVCSTTIFLPGQAGKRTFICPLPQSINMDLSLQIVQPPANGCPPVSPILGQQWLKVYSDLTCKIVDIEQLKLIALQMVHTFHLTLNHRFLTCILNLCYNLHCQHWSIKRGPCFDVNCIYQRWSDLQ